MIHSVFRINGHGVNRRTMVAFPGMVSRFSFHTIPDLASVSKGNAIFIRSKKLEALHDFHQKKNAEIVEPLENKPWGMASYTVREINGYYVIFAGAPVSDRNENSTELPSAIRIINRSPTIKEYQRLASAVGWSAYLDEADPAKTPCSATLMP